MTEDEDKPFDPGVVIGQSFHCLSLLPFGDERICCCGNRSLQRVPFRCEDENDEQMNRRMKERMDEREMNERMRDERDIFRVCIGTLRSALLVRFDLLFVRPDARSQV